MTKIPSVEQRVEEFKKQFLFFGINRRMTDEEYNVLKETICDREHPIICTEPDDIHDYFRQTLTADRTALLTELLEWADVNMEPRFIRTSGGREIPNSLGVGANLKLHDLKAYINNLINPTNI